MLRRLYFLLPNEKQAKQIVDELTELGIDKHRVHALIKGREPRLLPPATARQKADTAYQLEWLIWNMNLALFVLALVVFIAGLLYNSIPVTIISALVMLVSFMSGGWFVSHVPDAHLNEFSDALAHGEVLLMIDVSRQRVAFIENYIHRNHPEAATGGVSWAIDAFGI